MGERKKYLSGEILNELKGLMSQHVRVEVYLSSWMRQLIFSTRSSFVQLMDGWTMISTFFEDPLELICFPMTDSETLTIFLKDCLIRKNQLPLANCHGQAHDGAASMSGHVSREAARIQHEEPAALFIHCLAHSVNF